MRLSTSDRHGIWTHSRNIQGYSTETESRKPVSVDRYSTASKSGVNGVRQKLMYFQRKSRWWRWQCSKGKKNRGIDATVAWAASLRATKTLCPSDDFKGCGLFPSLNPTPLKVRTFQRPPEQRLKVFNRVKSIIQNNLRHAHCRYTSADNRRGPRILDRRSARIMGENSKLANIADDKSALEIACYKGTSRVPANSPDRNHFGLGLHQIDKMATSTASTFQIWSGNCSRGRSEEPAEYKPSLQWQGTMIRIRLTRAGLDEHHGKHDQELILKRTQN